MSAAHGDDGPRRTRCSSRRPNPSTPPAMLCGAAGDRWRAARSRIPTALYRRITLTRTLRRRRRMKFGLRYASLGKYSNGPAAVELAQAAEAAGFESMWTVEHVVVPNGYQSKYPYSPT